MTRHSSVMNPYAGNVLDAGLRPIVATEEAIKILRVIPDFPSELKAAPPHIRLHHLMRVRELHVPAQSELALWRGLDLMVRDCYRHRDPRLNTTWADISGEVPYMRQPDDPPLAAAIHGPSGSGKSQAFHRCARGCFGKQVVDHSEFPGLFGRHQQVVWLSIEVPPSGKAIDLARALMLASKQATGTDRFDDALASKRKIHDGSKALDEWHQWALSNFLGCLHLDEVHNFFHLQSLKQRTQRKGRSGEPELSIQEDRALSWFLSVMNRGQYAVLASGTNDGINALSRRFSVVSRLSIMGFYKFSPFENAQDPKFVEVFLPELIKCQLTKVKIKLDAGLATTIYDLTGGVQRIIVSLWFAAHVVAFERNEDGLELTHFRLAASTLLAPLGPAVQALRSNDPNRLRVYEDLVQLVDPSVWIMG